MSHPNQPEAKAKKSGRRVALVIYGAIIAVFVVLASAQVTWQIFGGESATRPTGSCTQGLRELVLALDRAREAASTTPQKSESLALARFRDALLPEWREESLIALRCQDDSSALDTVRRLRYAEERAVRLESSELAPLRLAVRKLMEGPLGSSTK